MRCMKPTERLCAVLLHHHYANFLSPHHMVKNCPSTKNCEWCQQRHYSLLHLWEIAGSDEDVIDVADLTPKKLRYAYNTQPLEDSGDDEIFEINAKRRRRCSAGGRRSASRKGRPEDGRESGPHNFFKVKETYLECRISHVFYQLNPSVVTWLARMTKFVKISNFRSK